MGDIAEAFEQHLRSLSDSDWNALVERVRTPANPPDGQQPQAARGDAGKQAAAKRFGTPKPDNPGSETTSGKGADGRAEAQRRFGTKGEHQ